MKEGVGLLVMCNLTRCAESHYLAVHLELVFVATNQSAATETPRYI